MKCSNIVLLLLFCNVVTSGQDYYPLNVGDIWFYDYNTVIVDSLSEIDGQHYFVRKEMLSSILERVDSSGNIIRRDLFGTEYTWLKLNAAPGAEWETKIQSGGGYENYTAQFRSNNDTIIFHDSILYGCYNYFLRNTRTGNEISLWLAPGIGLVKTINNMFPNETNLIKARINQVRIPSKIIPPMLEIYTPLYKLGPAISLTSTFPMNIEFEDSTNIRIISKKRGPLNCRYSVYFNSITIEPEYGFTFNDSVTVYVSGNLTDIMGDSLDKDYVFTFSTENDMIPGNLFVKDDRSKIPIFMDGDFDLGDYDNDGIETILCMGLCS